MTLLRICKCNTITTRTEEVGYPVVVGALFAEGCVCGPSPLHSRAAAAAAAAAIVYVSL